MRTALLLSALLLAGCASEPETLSLSPPAGTDWAACPPTASRTMALHFRVEGVNDTGDRPAGIHRLDARNFLWVYASYNNTLREDRVARVNPVEVARDPEGVIHVCTRVDLVSELEVDREPRTYGVGARLTTGVNPPPDPIRVTVNWVAGCPCHPLPRGNATALFES